MIEVCKYCGCKLPSELLNTINIGESILCENCGTETINDGNEIAEVDIRGVNNNQTHGFFLRVYENVRNRKSPIERVYKDSDFPIRFKDNFKIVVSRLIYSHIRTLEPESNKCVEKLELNQEILDDLYEKVSPIINQRVKDKFLINLHRMRVKEFDKWLKLLQKKIKVNNRFYQDFVIYMRWLIREAFIIIIKLWDESELPIFERVIRDDLKAFKFNLYALSESRDNNELQNTQINNLKSHLKIIQKKPQISTFTLTGYNLVKDQIKNKHSDEYIYHRLITLSEHILDNFINQVRFKSTKIQANNFVNESLNTWVGNTADVILRGQSSFIKVSKHPTSYGFKYVVYLLKSRLEPYLDLPYIGYHKGSLYERLRTHIRDTLSSNFNENITRYIEKSLLLAMEKELTSIQEFILKIDSRVSYNEVNNLKSIYSWLLNNKGSKNRNSNKLYSFLIEEVLKKHFTVMDLEYHKKRSKALASESNKTINYKHKIRGKDVEGTIWPNGLNMVQGGGGGTELDYNLPLLDYVALVSLGFKHEEICKTLSKVYKRPIKSSTMSTIISQEFGSFEILQSRVLKPVIENLIKDNKNFEFRDIASSVRMDPKTLDSKLKIWFDGNGFNNLKVAVNSGYLDWSKISEFNAEVQRVLRGFTKTEWKKWLIKASKDTKLEDIAKHFGITKNWLLSKKFCNKLSTALVGEEIKLIGVLRRKLRQKKVIESLSLGEDPSEVLEYYFEIRYISPSQMISFYEKLFEGELSFEDIICKYSNNPDIYLDKY
ncbi:MAG: hypothetical protein ACFFG0_54805 [Candidatus Thorarchaeota archaeon]